MKKMSIIIAGLLLLSGCFPDERNNFMVPDSFGITSLENVVESSVHTGSFVLGIAKSGKGQSAAQVRISRDQDEIQSVLSAYNAEHDTEFEAVMGSLVEMDATEFDFRPGMRPGKYASPGIPTCWPVSWATATGMSFPSSSSRTTLSSR